MDNGASIELEHPQPGFLSRLMYEQCRTRTYTDVILSCSDFGQAFEAHRAILSAASPFFKVQIDEAPCLRPTILVTGVRPRTMQLLLQHIYLGKYNCSEEEFVQMLDTANRLSIKGLGGIHCDDGIPILPLEPFSMREAVAHDCGSYSNTPDGANPVIVVNPLKDAEDEKIKLKQKQKAESQTTTVVQQPHPAKVADQKPTASTSKGRKGKLSGRKGYKPIHYRRPSPIQSLGTGTPSPNPERDMSPDIEDAPLQIVETEEDTAVDLSKTVKRNQPDPKTMEFPAIASTSKAAAVSLAPPQHLPVSAIQDYFRQRSATSQQPSDAEADAALILQGLSVSMRPFGSKMAEQPATPTESTPAAVDETDGDETPSNGNPTAARGKGKGKTTRRSKEDNYLRDEYGNPMIGPNGKVMVFCELCNKELADPSSLYRHKKIHTNEKPHMCPYCFKVFIQRYNMRQHLCTHRDLNFTTSMLMLLNDDQLRSHLMDNLNTEIVNDSDDPELLNKWRAIAAEIRAEKARKAALNESQPPGAKKEKKVAARKRSKKASLQQAAVMQRAAVMQQTVSADAVPYSPQQQTAQGMMPSPQQAQMLQMLQARRVSPPPATIRFPPQQTQMMSHQQQEVVSPLPAPLLFPQQAQLMGVSPPPAPMLSPQQAQLMALQHQAVQGMSSSQQVQLLALQQQAVQGMSPPSASMLPPQQQAPNHLFLQHFQQLQQLQLLQSQQQQQQGLLQQFQLQQPQAQGQQQRQEEEDDVDMD